MSPLMYSLVVIIAAHIMLPPLATSRVTRFALMQDKSGSCIKSGYTTGCCNEGFCAAKDGSCYCDAVCYRFHDCCDDINMTECTPPTPTEYSPSMRDTLSCGIGTGCCTGSKCRREMGTSDCYCNVECYQDNACCEDIETLQCYPNGCRQRYGNKATCCDPMGNVDNCVVRLSSTSRCYCDQDCMSRNDCCPDFDKTCQDESLQDTWFENFLQQLRMKKLASEMVRARHDEMSYKNLLARIMYYDQLLKTITEK